MLKSNWFIVCCGRQVITQFPTMHEAQDYCKQQNNRRKGLLQFEIVHNR